MVISASTIATNASQALADVGTLSTTVSTHGSEITSLQTTKQTAFTAGEGLQFGYDMSTGAYMLKALSPFWVCGRVSKDGIVADTHRGRVGFTCNHPSQGRYQIVFDTPHPTGDYNIQCTPAGQASWAPMVVSYTEGSNTADGFWLLMEYSKQVSASDFSADWNSDFHLAVIA